ncbi:hypothetical protein [Burkholderia lata]|uniref:hypothetical protein n=1 Tax=Burkholderia lata (strain ATCC 17760 / DSM 23089 / LMG 22485 / NCIMB 9086 / R18194 / 383) TaxID=482957 RepID=UPI0020C72E36|nr:hypothetical protein [Burkholderia lata]
MDTDFCRNSMSLSMTFGFAPAARGQVRLLPVKHGDRSFFWFGRWSVVTSTTDQFRRINENFTVPAFDDCVRVRARGAARIARRAAEAARRPDQGRARQPGAARIVSVAVPAQRGAIRDANAHAYAWRIAAGSDGPSAAASSRDPQAPSTTVTLAAH